MGEKVSKKKKMWMLLLCVLVLLFSLIFIFNYINDNTQQNKDVLVTIQKEELQDMIDNGKTCWVYVGRDSCPDCQVFYPKLVEFLQTQQLLLMMHLHLRSIALNMIYQKEVNLLQLRNS